MNKWLIMALLFLFPIHWSATPIILMLLLLNIIVGGGAKKWVAFAQTSSHNRLFVVLFYAFYLLYIIGLIYSTNLKEGASHLEVKLSFLIVPLIIIGLHSEFENRNNQKLFIYSICFGALASGMIMIINSLLYSPHPELMISINHWQYYHHTYYALHLNIAIIFLLIDFKQKIISSMARVILLVLLSILVYLSGSRAGIISLFIIIILYFSSILYQRKLNVKYYFEIIVVFLFVGLMFMQHSSVKNTINNISDILSMENDSTKINNGMDRVLIWQNALDLIHNKPIFGYGTGSSNDAMNQLFVDKKLDFYAEVHYNAHNQFLETTLDVGVIGLLVLLIIFGTISFIALKTKNNLLLMLGILFFIGFLFESMLNRFMGVFPFVFFVFWAAFQNKKIYPILRTEINQS